MKTYTKAELAQNNGQNDKPVYIAHQGKVYDVSASKLWRGGMHMKRHRAGTDLTTDIQAAPHDTSVFERYPQVGLLQKEPQTVRPVPDWLGWLLTANPFFRRHPHPMTVHFPIAFMLSSPIFNLLFLVTGSRAFETTAFHCLGAGLLFTAVAMTTGFFTWWYNYMARMMKPVAIKIPLSFVILVIGGISFGWRWSEPGVMIGPQGINTPYLLLSLSFLPLITIVGWYGATLTFPNEKE